MPSAGAVCPPVIIPLRKAVPGKPSTHIDSSTYIELESETPDTKLYFSTDGSKPNPFQLKVGGRESTFKYKGPFSLKPGKRTLKAIAVSRDGLQESNVVTKAFTVDDIGPPDDEADLDDFFGTQDDVESVIDMAPVVPVIKPKPARSISGPIVKKKGQRSREAWASSTSSTFPNGANHFTPEAHHAKVQIPDGPFNPTNYSGTQMNFWGVAPSASVPALLNGGLSAPMPPTYPIDRAGQLGYLTDSMIRNIEQPKLSVGDVRALMDAQKEAQQQPPPVFEMPIKRDPEALRESPGEGDWKGQFEHIYAHLIKFGKTCIPLRTAISEPRMGDVIHAEFEEEEDEYTLTVSIAKSGPSKPRKVKAKPKSKPASPPPTPPPAPVPKVAKTIKAVTKAVSKPKKEAPPPPPPQKPKEKPKPAIVKVDPNKEPPPKQKKKQEAYFETEEYEAEGTVKAWPYFNADADCEVLRAALKGLGTDEDKLVNVLPYRNCSQRVEIGVMFKTMFGKNLRDDIDSDTSGDFGSLCKALCMAADEYDASEIHKAIKGLGTDDDCLIEILCTRTNAQIRGMKEVYKRMYGKEMEKDVKGDTSGCFRKLLVAQMACNRSEKTEFDRTQAKNDAKALYEAGEKKWGTDESMFNMILCQRSFPHLRAVFEEYKALSGKDMVDVIESEFSGDIRKGFKTVVRCIKDKPGYFANKLNKCMKGLGTEDSPVIRVCVSRCETDMVQIKKSFEDQFGGTLADWIRDDTSGNYQQILLALIGERPAPEPTQEEREEAEAEPEIEEVEEENIPYEGTVKPAEPFDPKKDCEVLKKAMKGFGTNEDAIIEVWPNRSCEQRQELKKKYKELYGKDLMKELDSEISGDFWHVIEGLGQLPADYDAHQLRKAMKGLGTDEDCLTEILCTRNNEEMDALKESYTRIFKRDIEKDLISETSGHLQRLLVSMVQANRPAGNKIDRRKARKDAKDLFEAGEDKWGTDESRFNVILCSRSFPQLRATFEEYEKLSEKDIEETIKEEMSGDLEDGLLTLVRCIRNRTQQFAKRLHSSMSGMGTDEDSMNRVCISRSEIDMVQIKEHYQQMFDKPLGEAIAGDISGDYRKTLLHLIGEKALIKK